MLIRDPQSKRRLPDEGAEVPDTSYWYRRLQDGDVVRVVDPVSAPVSAPMMLDPIPPLITRS